jgi:hypothetical protein
MINMFSKYGFNYVIFVFPCLLLSCHSESKEKDLFTQPPKSRNEVIQDGYKNLKFRSGDRIDVLDNVFCKRFKDTVIQYVFQDDVLESIVVGFEINKMNSDAFLNMFGRRGFKRSKPVSETAQAAFIEPSEKIHYDVYMGKSYVSFVHY